MIIDYIRAALDRGWWVFPLRPGTKIPATPNGLKDATNDRNRIESYWAQNPDANYGIACGASGLTVIDCDSHGELPGEWAAVPGIETGADVLAYLAEIGLGHDYPRKGLLMSTFWVSTPNRGHHFYFRGEGYRNSTSKLGPMVDVRGEGGYVVGPGSVIGGKRYEVVMTHEVAPIPGWLHMALTATQAPRDPGAVPKPIGPYPAPGFFQPSAGGHDYDWRAWEGERMSAMANAPHGSRHHTFAAEIMKLALAEKDGHVNLDTLRPAIEAIGHTKGRTPREIDDMIRSAREKATHG